MFVPEYRQLLDIHQCSFKKGCSTTDHLIRLKNTIQKAFIHRQHCLAIFFDLEKVYDTAWRFAILHDVADLSIRSRMLNCLHDFLSNRSYHVLLGSTLSRSFIEENRVPQGCILGTTLFVLKMSSTAKEIPKSVMYTVDVDDLQIACMSSNISTCEKQVQLTINYQHGQTKMGFSFPHRKQRHLCSY